MACMEFECNACGWYASHNNPGRVCTCPKCGGDVIARWDEENTYRDEYEEDRAERNRILRDMDPE